MGYVSKDIAVITEPKQLTLVSLPNFITFTSKPKTPVPFEYSVTVNLDPSAGGDIEALSALIIIEPGGVSHLFHGTTNPEDAGGSVFHVSTDKANTAENIRQALLNNIWFAASFDVWIPFTWTGATPVNGRSLSIRSKGTGADYNITVSAPGNTGDAAYTLTPGTISTNGDSISGEASLAEISLDVYTDPDVFLGQDDRPMTLDDMGRFAITLQKTYAGAPLWFELNGILQHFAGYNLPPSAPGWFNTGTIKAYRFTARKKSDATTSAQLFDNSTMLNGAYNAIGAVVPTDNWIRTPLIPISDEYDEISISGAGIVQATTVRFVFYNAAQVFLSAVFSTPPLTYQTAPIPSGAAFVGMMVANGVGIGLDPTHSPFAGTLMVNYGAPRAYEPYGNGNKGDAFTFYLSSVLYILNGYGQASDPINLNDYTFGYGTLKLLTNRPRTTYRKGQTEYINFIYADAEHGQPDINDFTLTVSYRVFTTGGIFLGVVYALPVQRTALNMVNTCRLDIDAVIAQYPTAGLIKVGVAMGAAPVSTEVEYTVLPECLHDLTQFTFLNRLGGWDNFNFDAPDTEESKAEIETFNRTVTPGHTKATGIESIYSTNLDTSVSVDGAPVTDAVAEWLKELAAARIILDGQGNYIVIEEVKLKVAPENSNMQIPSIKYHLSETFTND